MAQGSTPDIQSSFERAIWEVALILQRSTESTDVETGRKKEYVAEIIWALVRRTISLIYLVRTPYLDPDNIKLLQGQMVNIAVQAIQQDATLHWTRNPTFDWQLILESLDWVPPNVLQECRSNFAWLATNVKISTGKGNPRPPGFSHQRYRSRKQNAGAY